jgi:hypothetical protein
MDVTGMPASGARTVLPGSVGPLPTPVVVLIGLGALMVVMIPFLRVPGSRFSTMAHEGAHAMAGTFLGVPPLAVELNWDGGGSTWFPGMMRGPRAVVIGAMGYLGPSAFGLCAARLIETGHLIAVLGVAVVLLVVLLSLVRGAFGTGAVLAAIALLAVVMRFGHDVLPEVTAYAMTWLLLLSGVRVALAHGPDASDAWALSFITRLPRQFWALLWLAGTLLALVIGGKWMVLRS